MTKPDERPKYMQTKPLSYKWTIEERFRLILRILRKEFPPTIPVRVRRVKWEEEPSLVKMRADGYCHVANHKKKESEQYFLIVVRRDMDWAKQLDAIMHEWAHALTWDIPSRQDHHHDWAVAYGKIYRRLIED